MAPTQRHQIKPMKIMFDHIDHVLTKLAARKFGFTHPNMILAIAKYNIIKFDMEQGILDRHECQK
jgi:hypothetical protein